MQSACAILYCNLWPVPLYHIFPHYIIHGTIFVKKLLNTNMRLLFSLQLLSKTFLFLRIQQHITNVHKSSCKVAFIFTRFQLNEFSGQIFEKFKNSNFTKSHPVGTELLHKGGWKKRYDKVNSRFSQFCERT
jgi:hypothetical protein